MKSVEERLQRIEEELFEYDLDDPDEEMYFESMREDYEERRAEELADCICGAYQFTTKGMIQVADCICGRT